MGVEGGREGVGKNEMGREGIEWRGMDGRAIPVSIRRFHAAAMMLYSVQC